MLTHQMSRVSQAKLDEDFHLCVKPCGDNYTLMANRKNDNKYEHNCIVSCVISEMNVNDLFVCFVL